MFGRAYIFQDCGVCCTGFVECTTLCYTSTASLVTPMRPNARKLAQHGGPPSYLEESEPAEWDCVVMDGPKPPSLTDRTACTGLELLSCELLANPAAVADVLVLNLQKTPSWALSRKEGMGQNSSYSPAVSLVTPNKLSPLPLSYTWFLTAPFW